MVSNSTYAAIRQAYYEQKAKGLALVSCSDDYNCPEDDDFGDDDADCFCD